MSVHDFIQTLELEFEAHQNEEIAAQQKAYMRNQFDFYGIKTPERREITKPFLDKSYRPSKQEAFEIAAILWQKPQREFQHLGMDLLLKYQRQYEVHDMAFFEYLVKEKSWWDTVDMIAYKMMGSYFKKYPEFRWEFAQKWLDSDNIWLQRSAVLFQLNYKTGMDTDLLAHCIHALLGSKEFFINKAIGWVLRTYYRTEPDWVIDFVAQTDLHPLSKREALRLIR